jgi:hypothetical protein
MKVKKSNIEIVRSYLAGERPITMVGYSKKTKKRKEGEIWEDTKGIKWQQKNGYKVRINEQALTIKNLTQQICKCGQNIQFGNKLDSIFYKKTGKCFDCIIEEETKLRIWGIYPLYEKYKLLSNYLSELMDLRNKVIDSINYFEKSEGKSLDLLCNSEGFIEKFKGLNTETLLNNAKKDLEELNKAINIVSSDKNIAEGEYLTEYKKFQSNVKKQ